VSHFIGLNPEILLELVLGFAQIW